MGTVKGQQQFAMTGIKGASLGAAEDRNTQPLLRRRKAEQDFHHKIHC